MAITTQDELVSAAANWLARDDLNSFIPDFVVMAEAKFNRALRDEGNEVTTVLTPAADGTVALPTDYREPRAINAVSNGRPVSLESIERFTSDATPTRGGTPRICAVVGRTLSVYPVGPVTLVYYRGVSPLASGTNWLIQRDPDLYLYAVLSEAEAFNKNQPASDAWAARAEGALGLIVQADKRSRWGRGRVTPQGWNP